MSLRYLSLFSGIEAASVAWQALGWQPAAFCEIEPFPNAVLAEHYPDVPNLGDIAAVTKSEIARLGSIDVVIGGSPCQDLSVAGKRAGLIGERSGLFHHQMRLFHAARSFCGARFCVWENVPGAFSSQRGRDFAVVVGAMAGADIGVPRNGWRNAGAAAGRYGLCEWRVLDAQFFGLAQRRKRVFAVLDTGDWADRPPILLEPDGVRGDSAPRRQTGQDVAGTLRAGAGGGCGPGPDKAAQGLLIPQVANPLTARMHKGINTSVDEGQTPIVCATSKTTHALTAEGFDAGEDGTGRGTPVIGVNGRQDPVFGAISGALDTFASTQCVAFHENQRAEITVHDTAGAINTGGGKPGQGYPAVMQNLSVRRLTPVECERLQGFGDGYTAVQYRGKPASDGARYRALGNSMAVPVVRWIGQRIAMTHGRQGPAWP